MSFGDRYCEIGVRGSQCHVVTGAAMVKSGGNVVTGNLIRTIFCVTLLARKQEVPAG